jgi:hypothetical protein
MSPQDIVTMEKSPAYSQRFCTAAPAIKQLLPSVRLVYLLRDPVARAYSGFHQVRVTQAPCPPVFTGAPL